MEQAYRVILRRGDYQILFSGRGPSNTDKGQYEDRNGKSFKGYFLLSIKDPTANKPEKIKFANESKYTIETKRFHTTKLAGHIHIQI